jgi:hypothetical protein
MQSNSFSESKNNAFKLSTQVKSLLHEKGFSFLFNFQDYKYYKAQAKNAFNKVQAITELFIEENVQSKSDYNEYIF